LKSAVSSDEVPCIHITFIEVDFRQATISIFNGQVSTKHVKNVSFV